MTVRSFRRYTNLAATIHLLKDKSITLLNPATWDDKNDAYFMAEYKRYKEAKSVLALCFAETNETYHHWRVFSNGPDGVCIEFYKDKLLSTFEGDQQIVSGYVQYKWLKDIKMMKSVKVDELPFLKRYPYEEEHEYRVVYVDTEDAKEYQDYAIEIEWIKRITLSPWISQTLTGSVRHTLRSIEGCSGLKIRRSTLVGNDNWKKLTARVRPDKSMIT
jgi:Protein of unknown function (DUF2971)